MKECFFHWKGYNDWYENKENIYIGGAVKTEKIKPMSLCFSNNIGCILTLTAKILSSFGV